MGDKCVAFYYLNGHVKAGKLDSDDFPPTLDEVCDGIDCSQHKEPTITVFKLLEIWPSLESSSIFAYVELEKKEVDPLPHPLSPPYPQCFFKTDDPTLENLS